MIVMSLWSSIETGSESMGLHAVIMHGEHVAEGEDVNLVQPNTG